MAYKGLNPARGKIYETSVDELRNNQLGIKKYHNF